jgi:hypothetical protein
MARNAPVRRHAHGHTHTTVRERTVSAVSQARHTSHAPAVTPATRTTDAEASEPPDCLIKSAASRPLAGNQAPRTWQLRAWSADAHGTRTHPLSRTPGASIGRMNVRRATGQAQTPDSQEARSATHSGGSDIPECRTGDKGRMFSAHACFVFSAPAYPVKHT